jgi:leucyl aminopeptidase
MVSQLTARAGKGTIAITALTSTAYKKWISSQPKHVKTWLEAVGFEPEAGSIALVPGKSGELARVVLGLGKNTSPWAFAALPGRLPKGRYVFEPALEPADADHAALGWALATYEFTRYRKATKKPVTLVWPTGADRDAVTRTAEAIALGRDLVNTPAADLGPAELAAAAVELGERHGAKTSVITGKKLLDANYPAVFAVGRASSRPPCLVDLRWGDRKAKKITLVGKGVCFDTGGLDLKTAAGMKLMKKDMGGAASVLALAHMIMDAALDVRLRVLIPAVENSVSGDAYRPGDVISTRKGLSVEIGNTDAEGRVILSDALTEADSEKPDLLLDFATLTGAARVALGTELPALFCNDDAFAQAVLAAGEAEFDPLWRMPLHAPYRRHLDSPIADLNNISSSSTGGAITAALFLQEFVSRRTSWAHIDTMAWNQSNRPGRPQGGEVFGVRACFRAIRERVGA